jgi:hypothetical protein
VAMLVAAVTLWTMFSLWLIAPHAGIPAGFGRVAGILCAAELVALLTWSFGVQGCVERTCAPLGQAAGIAARTDIPALAAAFVVFTLAQLLRRRQPAP